MEEVDVKNCLRTCGDHTGEQELPEFNSEYKEDSEYKEENE
jgi:hypothetical protein